MLYDNRKRVIDLGQRGSIQGLRTKRRWQLVLSASEEITSLRDGQRAKIPILSDVGPRGFLNYFERAENTFVSAYRIHHKDDDAFDVEGELVLPLP